MRSATETLALGILSLVVNIVLMLVKIGVGLVGNSYALVADGIESASNIFSSRITWAGFRFSLRPADEEHPFGHGKLEALAGGFAGVTLLVAVGVIAANAVSEILKPHHAPEWFTLPVLIGVVVVKKLLSRRIFSAGEELGSTALRGDAWHHRSDAISSGAAALGIAVALITDFSLSEGDQLQLRNLSAGAHQNAVNGYLIGGQIYGAIGSANSYLYRDTDNSGAINAGDNLIAAIRATGGSGTNGALGTSDLNSIGIFV